MLELRVKPQGRGYILIRSNDGGRWEAVGEKGYLAQAFGTNEEDDPLAIWKNDLKSAFGSVFRSKSLEALEKLEAVRRRWSATPVCPAEPLLLDRQPPPAGSCAGHGARQLPSRTQAPCLPEAEETEGEGGRGGVL